MESLPIDGRNVSVDGKLITFKRWARSRFDDCESCTIHGRHLIAVSTVLIDPISSEFEPMQKVADHRLRGSGFKYDFWARGLALFIEHPLFHNPVTVRGDHVILSELESRFIQVMKLTSPTLGDLLATQTKEVRDQVRVLLDLIENLGLQN